MDKKGGEWLGTWNCFFVSEPPKPSPPPPRHVQSLIVSTSLAGHSSNPSSPLAPILSPSPSGCRCPQILRPLSWPCLGAHRNWRGRLSRVVEASEEGVRPTCVSLIAGEIIDWVLLIFSIGPASEVARLRSRTSTSAMSQITTLLRLRSSPPSSKRTSSTVTRSLHVSRRAS